MKGCIFAGGEATSRRDWNILHVQPEAQGQTTRRWFRAMIGDVDSEYQRTRSGAGGGIVHSRFGAIAVKAVFSSGRHERRVERSRVRGVAAQLGSERGAALVEMAVASTLLLTLLLGIVTFGITQYQNIAIEGAAREAVRFGATYAVEDAGSLQEWLRDVAQVAENAATGALSESEPSRLVCVAQGSGNDSDVCSRITVAGMQLIASAGEESGWCFENTAPGGDTVVQVQLQREGWIEAIVFSMKPTLTGEATNRFERAEA